MNTLKVLFRRDAEQRIRGRIVSLSSQEYSIEVTPGFGRNTIGKKQVPVTRKMQRKTKVVLINGYGPERSDSWKGRLPEDGEIWLCEEVRDTMPDEPEKGAFIVRLKCKLDEPLSEDSAVARYSYTVAPPDSILRALDWGKK